MEGVLQDAVVVDLPAEVVSKLFQWVLVAIY